MIAGEMKKKTNVNINQFSAEKLKNLIQGCPDYFSGTQLSLAVSYSGLLFSHSRPFLQLLSCWFIPVTFKLRPRNQTFILDLDSNKMHQCARQLSRRSSIL